MKKTQIKDIQIWKQKKLNDINKIKLRTRIQMVALGIKTGIIFNDPRGGTLQIKLLLYSFHS